MPYRDGDTKITESSTIVEYLEEKYPDIKGKIFPFQYNWKNYVFSNPPPAFKDGVGRATASIKGGKWGELSAFKLFN